MSDPQAIGDYKVARKLGVGLMGPVYLGTFQGAYWALRVINDNMVRHTNTVGKLVGDVMHDSLVRYKEMGADSTVGGFLSTDYVDAKQIGRDALAGLSSSQRLEFVCNLLEGVNFLHGRGAVHGCIKRSNVLLRGKDKNIQGLLIDAGLVYVPSQGNDFKLLRRAYPTMAPELIRAYIGGDRKAIDAALTAPIDVYGAGMLVAEVFSGRVFFDDARSIDELLKLKTSTRIEMSGVNSPHPHLDLASLNRAVAAATASDPGSRPTIRDFIDQVKACALEKEEAA